MTVCYWHRLGMLKLIILVINLFSVPYKAKEPYYSVFYNQQSLNRSPKIREVLYHHEVKVLKEVLGSYHPYIQNKKHLKKYRLWETGLI